LAPLPLLKKHEIRGKFRLRVLTDANSLTLRREARRAGAGFYWSALYLSTGNSDRENSSEHRCLFHHRDRSLGRAALAIKAMIEEEVGQLCQSRSEIVRPLKRGDARLAGQIRK
jgi:hypothetical protein